jgi:hypothetical protein
MPLLPRRRKRKNAKVIAKKAAPKHKLATKRKHPPTKKKAKKKVVKKPAAVKKPVAVKKPPVVAAPAPPSVPVASISRPAPAPVAVVPQPLPTPPAPVVPTPPAPDPTVPTPPTTGTFGAAQAERLLWRAGFGPKPGDAERLAAMGLDAAVASLVRPVGAATLVGPEPHDENGFPLAPEDLWGHDAVWWLDRMVRSDQPLVERMTLVWHDWFANSRDKVGSARMMLAQNAIFREHALGSFEDLLHDITHDPAMLVFLDGIENAVWSPNENYAREIMELFTLGAGRGAYTEDDVRELARAFTGYTADWNDSTGLVNFRIVDSRRDTGTKTIFGHTGAWDIDDGWRLCLEHPLHASYFVTKLWSAFIPSAPSDATVTALAAAYVASGHQIAPVVEAILKHPDLYTGPSMVKAPAVYAAGLLRESGRYVDTDMWSWLLQMAGQQLFFPPNVSGWDEARWLDTSTWRGRWYVAAFALRNSSIDPWDDSHPYSATETVPEAIAAALAYLGNPSLSPELRAGIAAAADTLLPASLAGWQQGPYRAMRQNALRILIATCSDHQTS